MGDLLKYGRAWAITGMASKAATAAALLLGAVAFAFGDGGTLTVSWMPGGGL
jgi:hypothetical protein